jgi:hypothetical protein
MHKPDDDFLNPQRYFTWAGNLKSWPEQANGLFHSSSAVILESGFADFLSSG